MQNYNEAFKCYSLGSGGGVIREPKFLLARSYCGLGNCYYGARQDRNEAFRCYQHAAEWGNEDALRQCYRLKRRNLQAQEQIILLKKKDVVAIYFRY